MDWTRPTTEQPTIQGATGQAAHLVSTQTMLKNSMLIECGEKAENVLKQFEQPLPCLIASDKLSFHPKFVPQEAQYSGSQQCSVLAVSAAPRDKYHSSPEFLLPPTPPWCRAPLRARRMLTPPLASHGSRSDPCRASRCVNNLHTCRMASLEDQRRRGLEIRGVQHQRTEEVSPSAHSHRRLANRIGALSSKLGCNCHFSSKTTFIPKPLSFQTIFIPHPKPQPHTPEHLNP